MQRSATARFFCVIFEVWSFSPSYSSSSSPSYHRSSNTEGYQYDTETKGSNESGCHHDFRPQHSLRLPSCQNRTFCSCNRSRVKKVTDFTNPELLPAIAKLSLDPRVLPISVVAKKPSDRNIAPEPGLWRRTRAGLLWHREVRLYLAAISNLCMAKKSH